VIQCSCPIVAHRLLTIGGDLRPVLLPLVPPPVAVARYVRSLAQPTRTRITYVGACPGAVDESIDIRMTPDALIAMLAERDIILEEQPHVFESVIPPDRRRHRSQPGGVPTAEALWTELGSRSLIEVDGDDFIAEVAQLLLTGKNVLIDTSARLGCACAGAVNGARHPRGTVVALEPPRSTTPIVDERSPISLDLPVPASSRTPVDVVALSMTPPSSPRQMTPPSGIEPPFGNRISPVRANLPPPDPRDPRSPRTSGPIAPRAVLSAFPVTRDGEGKSLPRAYIARRRSSPKGISLALPPEDPGTDPAAVASVQEPTPSSQQTQPVRARTVAPAPINHVEPRSPIVEPSVVAQPPAPVVTEPVAIVAPTSAAPNSTVHVGAPYTPEVAAPPLTRAPQPQPWSGPTPSGLPASTSDDSRAAPEALSSRRSRPEESRTSAPPAWTISRGQFVGILFAIVMIAISVSTVIAILVGRSVSASVGSQLGR
ncbi:MAG: hypothetical protein ACREPM_26000, partial [Gemmatimonadaceae bacterium]